MHAFRRIQWVSAGRAAATAAFAQALANAHSVWRGAMDNFARRFNPTIKEWVLSTLRDARKVSEMKPMGLIAPVTAD